MKYDLIIFDLDGTLLNTSEGIFNSVRYAEKSMNLSPVSDEVLKSFVGPPPKEMYKKVYGLNEEDALKATGFHREYGKTRGVYEAYVYEGIEDVLKTFKNNGIKLAVATLKGENIAISVLEKVGICKYFDAIVGMDIAEIRKKSDTIKIAIEKTGAKHPVMVGDSLYDAVGAKEVKVDFVPVTYGFGFQTESEINENPYIIIVKSVDGILRLEEINNE